MFWSPNHLIILITPVDIILIILTITVDSPLTTGVVLITGQVSHIKAKLQTMKIVYFAIKITIVLIVELVPFKIDLPLLEIIHFVITV